MQIRVNYFLLFSGLTPRTCYFHVFQGNQALIRGVNPPKTLLVIRILDLKVESTSKINLK